ncbi:MAG: RNA polymerase sigma factor [Oscillospiraceae bacterium]|nr:RNA polymerase sigma factor [Oscillospiraceae bacterium]
MRNDIHAIISDVAKGDMDSFGELYNLLSERIFNYARTITRNREMAEDITHDVFLQVHKHAARIDKMADPVAYIMVSARNHSYNMLKRENRAADLQDDAIDTACSISSAFNRILFKDAFNDLPANQREAVYLHLICGYKHKDIAIIQNVPLVTVKWRYGQALSKLKEYFTQSDMGVKCDERI